MKKKITTALLTLATALGFAQEANPDLISNLAKLELPPAPLSLKEKVSGSRSFAYLTMGVSDSNLQTTAINAIPGLGIGYRFVSGPSAIDISTSFNRKEIVKEGSTEKTYLFTAPKVNYLYYLNSLSKNSFYAGGGLAWGGVRTENAKFDGLIPNVALGYAFNQLRSAHSAVRTFVQLDISQPVIASVRKGDLPKPFAQMAFGAGF